MATLVGFGAFAALAEEQISEKISRRILSGNQGMLVWWSIAAGVQLSRTATQMSRSCGCSRAKWNYASAGNSGSAAQVTSWSFREVRSTTPKVIDFFAPPREDFLVGGKPAYMSDRSPKARLWGGF
jgi:hypothetical protein